MKRERAVVQLRENMLRKRNLKELGPFPIIKFFIYEDDKSEHLSSLLDIRPFTLFMMDCPSE